MVDHGFLIQEVACSKIVRTFSGTFLFAEPGDILTCRYVELYRANVKLYTVCRYIISIMAVCNFQAHRMYDTMCAICKQICRGANFPSVTRGLPCGTRYQYKVLYVATDTYYFL